MLPIFPYYPIAAFPVDQAVDDFAETAAHIIITGVGDVAVSLEPFSDGLGQVAQRDLPLPGPFVGIFSFDDE